MIRSDYAEVLWFYCTIIRASDNGPLLQTDVPVMIELSVSVQAAHKQQKGASENKGIFSLISKLKNLQFFHCGFRVTLVRHLYFSFYEKEQVFAFAYSFLFVIFALFSCVLQLTF